MGTNVSQSQYLIDAKSSFFGDIISPNIYRIEEDIIEKQKLKELRQDIGDDLFSSLSDEDKEFILNTEGSVDLGFAVTEKDLSRILNFIENDNE